MNLKIGIVGLPNVGKSTLFNALTKQKVDVANYPFCTIDPSVGIVSVPDSRLNDLAEMVETKKKINAIIEFVDIAGLVKGASKGAGMGNAFLSNIRDVDVILHVVRIFDDEEIVHVEGKTDPFTDAQIINLELIEADKQVLEKRKKTNEKILKKGDKEAKFLDKILNKAEKILDKEKFISQFLVDFSDEELNELKKLRLLTIKKVLYVLNKDLSGSNIDSKDDDSWENFMNYLQENNASWIIIDTKTEEELNEFSEEEKSLYKEELNSSLDDTKMLIKKSYELLNLISFFTVGKKETRAWTISKNSTAPEAGSVIHNDFKDKFIRAEVINAEKLLAFGEKKKAREKGALKMEGKDYVVQDGDVIEFHI